MPFNSQKLNLVYNKSYKYLLILSGILILLSLFYLWSFYQQNEGNFLHRDISLIGGTTITLYEQVNPQQLKQDLSSKLEDLDITQLYDIATREQKGVIIETRTEPGEAKKILEDYLQKDLTEENSSVEFTGSALGEGFYQQLLTAMLASFLLMGMVVFLLFAEDRAFKLFSIAGTAFCISILFDTIGWLNTLISFIALPAVFISLAFILFSKKSSYRIFWKGIFAVLILIYIIDLFLNISFLLIPFIIALLAMYVLYSTPSAAVIISAFADIIMTLVVVNIIGMKISAAGIVGFLLLIGYSVDTDILLTARLLKREEGRSVNRKIFEAFKTGITMTGTSFAAVIVALLLVRSFSPVLTQIFTIILIGLCFDVYNTWTTNASLLKWYTERKQRATQ